MTQIDIAFLLLFFFAIFWGWCWWCAHTLTVTLSAHPYYSLFLRCIKLPHWRWLLLLLNTRVSYYWLLYLYYSRFEWQQHGWCIITSAVQRTLVSNVICYRRDVYLFYYVILTQWAGFFKRWCAISSAPTPRRELSHRCLYGPFMYSASRRTSYQ